MLSFFTPLAVSQPLPLAEAGQLLLVVGIAFAIITLIASTHRFHTMIELGEEDLTSVDDCNDFFFIQVTRYLSKINRTSSGFGLMAFQFQTSEPNPRETQELLLNQLKSKIREQSDKACLLGEDCIGIILDAEEEKTEAMAERMVQELSETLKIIPAITAFRAGTSSFPLHGSNSRDVIDAAMQAAEAARFEDALPLYIAPPPEGEERPEEEKLDDAGIGEISKGDKSSAIDPLTGVLKPAVIGSYMRKYLAELRHKKEPASVLCVGINRIDQIVSLQGEQAADAVIRGVSQRLQKLTRDSDLIGRYHRDDFLILAPCELKEGEKIALRVRDAIQKELFLVEGKRIKTSVSVGITAYPDHGRSLRELFRGAYTALEIIREWDTSSCLIYDPKQHAKKAPNASKTQTRR